MSKKPTNEEMMAAALTVLRLGAPEGSPLAALVKDTRAVAKVPKRKRPTVAAAKPERLGAEPHAGHVFDPKWKKVIHTCPKCGTTGPVDPVFGMRLVRGEERKQSWCVNCRASTNYHAMPRLADRKRNR